MMPPLVLLHGLGGSPAVWDRMRALLPQTVTIAAPRLCAPHSIETEADAVASVAQRLGTPAVVVGHSRGGLVATALAERHPHLVQRLVLINTPATTTSRLTARAGSERVLSLPLIGDLVWHMMTPQMIARGLASAFAPGHPVPDQFVDDLRDTGRTAFVAASKAIDRYLQTKPLLTRLHRIAIPSHIVFGVQDQRVSFTPYQESPADSRVHITTVPGAGHTPIWERPQAVAAVLLEMAR